MEKKIITYECDMCGCRVTVAATPDTTELSPIYCCGAELVAESCETGSGKRKKKTATKAAKKKVTRKPLKKAA